MDIYKDLANKISHHIKENVDFYNEIQDIFLFNRPISFILLVLLLNFVVFAIYMVHKSFYTAAAFWFFLTLKIKSLYAVLTRSFVAYVENRGIDQDLVLNRPKYSPKELAAFVSTIKYLIKIPYDYAISTLQKNDVLGCFIIIVLLLMMFHMFRSFRGISIFQCFLNMVLFAPMIFSLVKN